MKINQICKLWFIDKIPRRFAVDWRDLSGSRICKVFQMLITNCKNISGLVWFRILVFKTDSRNRMVEIVVCFCFFLKFSEVIDFWDNFRTLLWWIELLATILKVSSCWISGYIKRFFRNILKRFSDFEVSPYKHSTYPLIKKQQQKHVTGFAA